MLSRTAKMREFANKYRLGIGNYQSDQPTILFLIPAIRRLVGSAYKYATLFTTIANVTILRDGNISYTMNQIHEIKPDAIFVMGDRYREYIVPKSLELPYYIVEQDIMSLRSNTGRHEPDLIKGAEGIIFTSQLHEQYIREKYDVKNTITIPLYPFRRDLKFEKLPKLDGRNLVFAGSILPKQSIKTDYGYRYYQAIFRRFKKLGWKIHIYPSYVTKPQTIVDYIETGCIIHNHVPHRKLFKELTQYQAGFHGYNKIGVDKKAFEYTQTCAPNKTFDYYAAGIPTISFQGGYSGKIIEQGGWGVVIKHPDEINKINLPDFKFNPELHTIDSEINKHKLKRLLKWN